MYKVSVIIPVYNRENLVKRCLESVINQSMPKEDYEIIVVDDASTDNTYTNVLKYQDMYPNLIKPFQLIQNSKTASVPRNEGIRIATGEYIYFVDSDDFIHEYTLSDAHCSAHENNSDIVLIKAVTFNSKTRSIRSSGKLFRQKLYEKGVLNLNELPNDVVRPQFYRRSRVIEHNFKFSDDISLGEDFLFNTSFLLNIQNVQISAIGNKDYYFYVANMDEFIEDGIHLTDTPFELDKAVKRAKLFCEVVFQKKHFTADKVEYLEKLFSRLTGQTFLLPHIIRKLDRKERWKITYRDMDEKALAAYSALFNESIPAWADKYFKADDMLILHAIRRNDKELLIKYCDHIEQNNEQIKLAKWLEKNELPHYIKRKKPFDIMLTGWHDNSNIGGSLNFYAAHEVLKSAKLSVVVANTTKEEDITVGKRLHFDIVSEYYQMSGYLSDKGFHKTRKFANTFVVGSDQLWNASYSSNFTQFYLGKIGDCKKVSFSTSFGQEEHAYRPKIIAIAKHLLKKFDHISVREDSGIDILAGLGVEGATCILDPVFLVPSGTFERLMQKSSYRMQGKSIFAYVLDADKSQMDFFVKLKEQLKVDTAYGMTTVGSTEVQIEDKKLMWSTFSGVEFDWDATSADFLYNINNSEFIFTDSYHGACFAILAKKPFLLVRNSRRGQARYILFEKLGLMDRIVDKDNLASALRLLDQNIDWNHVYSKLNILRFHSFKWLEMALERKFPLNFEMQNVSTISESQCTGCEVCKASCPVDAIEMVVNREGFAFPKINHDCINCGVCKNVCPAMNILSSDDYEKQAYAVMANDQDRSIATSGGMFGLGAEYILGQGGSVAGVRMTSDFSGAEHVLISDINDLQSLKNSKYIQSRANDIHQLVKGALEKGKSVLFSGTPCQVSGMKNYMNTSKTDTSNLITMDFICHGPGSPLVWKSYLKETFGNRKINEVNFHSKEEGWQSELLLLIALEDGYIHREKSGKNSPWYDMFLKHKAIIRKSCHNCQYANLNRPGDITIADFRGVDKLKREELNDGKGTSAVFVNTEKGQVFFDALRVNMKLCEQVEVKSIANNQRKVKSAIKETSNRKLFFEQFGETPIIDIIPSLNNVKPPAHKSILPLEKEQQKVILAENKARENRQKLKETRLKLKDTKVELSNLKKKLKESKGGFS